MNDEGAEAELRGRFTFTFKIPQFIIQNSQFIIHHSLFTIPLTTDH